MRRILRWVLPSLALSLSAAADPVPVLVHGVGDRLPSAAELERVASAVGGDALRGEALRGVLLQRFGRFAPREDVLAAQRAEIAAGWEGYFRSGPRGARRRLADAAAAMEAAPDALALREDNRAAYLRAVTMLARIALESRQTAEAEGWMRKALAVEPAWAPPSSDFPPPVQQLASRLRGDAQGAADGARLVVTLPREGCGVTVDGVAQPGTGREQTVRVRPGPHRVSAACSAASRVREVVARAGEELALRIDPALDARVQLSADPAVVYAAASDESSLLAGDAAAVGRAVGARQVVTVGAGRVRVVDVEGAWSLGELDVAQGDLASALSALRAGRAGAVLAATELTPPPSSAPRTVRGGAGPWVLVGSGGALVAAGVVFWVLRGGAYDDLARRCPFVDGTPECADASAQSTATADRDRANLWQGMAIGAWAAGGVALTSGLLWYALGGRGTERVAVRASPRGASLTLRW